MLGSKGASNGSHEEFREGRIFRFVHPVSRVSVEVTYPEPISGQQHDSVKYLVAYLSDFLAKLELVEDATDLDRATAVTIVNLLLESPEDIIRKLQQTGKFGVEIEFEEDHGELTWIMSQPPTNVDVASN